MRALVCKLLVIVSLVSAIQTYGDDQLPRAVRQFLIKDINESYNTPDGGKLFSFNIDQTAEGTVTDVLKIYGEVKKVYCARCTIDALTIDLESLNLQKAVYSRQVFLSHKIILQRRDGELVEFSAMDLILSKSPKEYTGEPLIIVVDRLRKDVWSKTCPFRMPDG